MTCPAWLDISGVMAPATNNDNDRPPATRATDARSVSLECWNAASSVVCESAYCSEGSLRSHGRQEQVVTSLAATGGKLTFYNKSGMSGVAGCHELQIS